MICFRRPTDAEIREYLSRQGDQSYSYSTLGGTRHGIPIQHGWDTDCNEVLLGQGEATFQKAKEALDSWKMFPPEITTVFGHKAPCPDLTVAVLYRANPLPLYLLMPARVIYVVAETYPRGAQHVERYGFAYGTLPDHPECGEERFVVEWDRNDDSVHYNLVAISRPNHWLVRLGYPYTRHQQARFRRLSGVAMQRAVAEPEPKDLNRS